MEKNRMVFCNGKEGELPGNIFFCPLKEVCLRYESKEIEGLGYFLKLPYNKTEEKCNFLIKKSN